MDLFLCDDDLVTMKRLMLPRYQDLFLTLTLSGWCLSSQVHSDCSLSSLARTPLPSLANSPPITSPLSISSPGKQSLPTPLSHPGTASRY